MNSNDFNSTTWLTLVVELEARLALLRSQNDATLNEIETAKLRGRLAELKRIIALPHERERREMSSDDGTY